MHAKEQFLSFALAAEFFEQLDLDLLNLEQPVVLPAQQVIDFLVQMPNLQLGFQIHFVIVFRAQTIASLGAVLAHHDDRRLNRSQAGEDQVQQNEWIGIESAIQQKNG